MNTCSFGSISKRTVLHAHHAAPRVSDVGLAALFARLFRVRSAGKIRPLAAKERSSLFLFGIFGRNAASSKLAQFFLRRVGPHVFSELRKHFGMASCKVFMRGQALQIVDAVIRFDTVNVMHLFTGVKIGQPTCSYRPVDQCLAPHAQVPAVVLRRSVWKVLSENFSAARHGVKVAKSAVFNAVHHKADHVVPRLVANRITYTPS